jgi:hypothetical protein
LFVVAIGSMWSGRFDGRTFDCRRTLSDMCSRIGQPHALALSNRAGLVRLFIKAVSRRARTAGMTGAMWCAMNEL